LVADYAIELPIAQWIKDDDKLYEEQIRERIISEIEASYVHKESLAGTEVLRQFEKSVMLQTLDNLWKEHLAAMDHLRQGIHLRGYAQKNPKQEYKREAFELFTQMLESLKQQVVGILCRVQVQEPDVEAIEAQRRQAEAATNITYTHQETNALSDDQSDSNAENKQASEFPKVGRNEPCPCGSGKKYKQCHGKLA